MTSRGSGGSGHSGGLEGPDGLDGLDAADGFTWARLEEVFEQAQALPIEARDAFLHEQCANQPALRAQVEALLAAADGDRALHIERLVVDARPDCGGLHARGPYGDGAHADGAHADGVHSAALESEPDPWVGQRLGPWRLTRIIGRGGMGVVYGAERADGQYQLDVAVKLMRAGPRDGQAIDRFRTERQVLASLKHPSIAGLLDGGFASDGTPYLVMELVDGVPITEWCNPADAERPSLERRLRLFQIVCDAVQHAHRALVVHRDLKPRNIFVTRSGEVKLLDFGIAKLLEPEAWGLPASETRIEMRAFTPDYAAPEQLRGGAITTATDVYALGVVLYEIVAGVRPATQDGGGARDGRYARERPDERNRPDERDRRDEHDKSHRRAEHSEHDGREAGGGRGASDGRSVRDGHDGGDERDGRGGPHARAVVDAPTTLTPPSEAVRRGLRQTPRREPGREEHGLVRRIRGDLDRIILTALREEPDRRYASAGQLGEEIGRFLDGRAVLAQPDTLGYRVRKFVGRNRLAVTASAVFVASLIVFGAVSAYQARVLFEQRRIAQLERDTSEQVVRVLIDLFEAANPAVRPDGDRIPLGEFLRDAQARALAGLREAPAVRAKLQHVLGSIQYTRGAYDPARAAVEEALALQRRLAGPDHPDTLESLYLLGQIAHYGGDEERARALLEESLERHRRVHGDRHPLTARALFALAPIVAARDLDRAGEMLRSGLEIRQAALPANHPDIAEGLAALGGYALRRGNVTEAREFYRRALETYPGAQDRRNPAAITILGDYATVLNRMREYDEAGKLQREAIELSRHVLGPKSITLANLENNLGTTQALAGRHAEAEQSFRAAFETHRSLLGDDHRRTRNVARNVGRALALQQRYAEALPWMDRALGDPTATAGDAGGVVNGAGASATAGPSAAAGPSASARQTTSVQSTQRASGAARESAATAGGLRTAASADAGASAAAGQIPSVQSTQRASGAARESAATADGSRATAFVIADAGILGIRAQRAHVLFRLDRRAEAIAIAAATVTSLEGLARDDSAAALASARVILGRMLIEMDRPRPAEPILAAALQFLDRLGDDHPQRAEAACELARARVLMADDARSEGLAQMRQCLPIYKAWGLAEREVVADLERLTAISPAPAPTSAAASRR